MVQKRSENGPKIARKRTNIGSFQNYWNQKPKTLMRLLVIASRAILIALLKHKKPVQSFFNRKCTKRAENVSELEKVRNRLPKVIEFCFVQGGRFSLPRSTNCKNKANMKQTPGTERNDGVVHCVVLIAPPEKWTTRVSFD